jgi:X-X-X-Leu-X-X-Gly heptad repeat protein
MFRFFMINFLGAGLATLTAGLATLRAGLANLKVSRL